MSNLKTGINALVQDAQKPVDVPKGGPAKPVRIQGANKQNPDQVRKSLEDDNVYNAFVEKNTKSGIFKPNENFDRKKYGKYFDENGVVFEDTADEYELVFHNQRVKNDAISKATELGYKEEDIPGLVESAKQRLGEEATEEDAYEYINDAIDDGLLLGPKDEYFNNIDPTDERSYGPQRFKNYADIDDYLDNITATPQEMGATFDEFLENAKKDLGVNALSSESENALRNFYNQAEDTVDNYLNGIDPDMLEGTFTAEQLADDFIENYSPNADREQVIRDIDNLIKTKYNYLQDYYAPTQQNGRPVVPEMEIQDTVEPGESEEISLEELKDALMYEDIDYDNEINLENGITLFIEESYSGDGMNVSIVKDDEEIDSFDYPHDYDSLDLAMDIYKRLNPQPEKSNVFNLKNNPNVTKDGYLTTKAVEQFEGQIPRVMRYKKYEVLADGTLYWVTQQGFDESQLESFKKALKNLGLPRAYVILRDNSSYDFDEDAQGGQGYWVE